jgi:hypothetical protein
MQGKAYKIGVAFSTLALVAAAILIWTVVSTVLFSGAPPTPEIIALRLSEGVSESGDVDDTIFVVRLVTQSWLVVFLCAIVTALTVIFGWRRDRIEAQSLRSRVAQLEAELRAGQPTS